MTETRYYVNGQQVAKANYVVPADDDGFLRGLAAFETIRTHNGRFFRAPQHIARLLASVDALEIGPVSNQALLQECGRAIENFEGDARLRITLTAGGVRLMEVAALDQAYVNCTLTVATRNFEPPAWLGGRVKHCSRAMNQVARAQAGVDEIFWIGRDGNFTEAIRSNIFAVVNNVVVTPPDDGRILSGVTRSALIELARDNNIPLVEGPIKPTDDIAELYASSTLKHLAAVIELDGIPGPGGGPIGARLNELFTELIKKECQA